MPKRQDIKKILIIGSGPIVIGQACEFDYSGTQACKALMSEGYEVILVNSNPATIMTDPDISTRVYIEPLNVQSVKKIIEKERPQALIPTLGGQTALNLALELDKNNILKEFSVELLAAEPQVIEAAEDREKFRSILDGIGAKYPKSEMVRTFEDGLKAADKIGYPIILRPNYTLGGGGGGIAYSPEEYSLMLAKGLNESPTSEVLVEESILGWKEYELEVMRDSRGTFVVVCNIENLDPCGVHTGDSITVAPQQTLSDYEYQEMRDEACKILNKVGVKTGGANVQFAVHPKTSERVVIEMNPRVSRSSALASKATGFPIAKIAALLSVGYNLDEITNDITKVTPCCYEPALDYVVTKIPRFAFEKFSGAKDFLTTQMKSVGEVMGIGRTFKESLMKSILSLEQNAEGVPDVSFDSEKLTVANSQRIFHLFQGFREGYSLEQIQNWTEISPWFLEQIQELVRFEQNIKTVILNDEILLKAKRYGFSDERIAKLTTKNSEMIYNLRKEKNILPGYLMVDTCAGEFASSTPYFYSTYWSSLRADISHKTSQSVVVIGSGPNRIGQGIEFDYSCVRAVKALRKNKLPVAMINSNPETVSTDYDTSDYLFFEPLTKEHVTEVLDYIKPKGYFAQFGGQTPINLVPHLARRGYQILGSDQNCIDRAEDRKKFGDICKQLNLKIPKSSMVATFEDAQKDALDIGYPVICRPSYVLGGRRMEVCETETELKNYFTKNKNIFSKDNPCLIDQFLIGALEVDVDLVRGLDWVLIGGVVEHIEAAGVHSGDSMGVLPPQRLKPTTSNLIEQMSIQLATKLNVIGHLNLQLAIKNDEVYVLEANPRSSRSVPFIVKATGIPIVDLAIEASLLKKKSDLKLQNMDWKKTGEVSVKGVVFPFKKFAEADSLLGPEMKSTGESMGRANNYPEALMKAFQSSHVKLPVSGEVFFSLKEKDKPLMLETAKQLLTWGYSLSATKGTADYFIQHDLPVKILRKVHEGRPNCVDHLRMQKIALVINTTQGKNSIEASFDIRRACLDYGIPCLTETDTVVAFILALKNKLENKFEVKSLDRTISF